MLKKKIHPEHWQVMAAYLMIYDLIVIAAGYFLLSGSGLTAVFRRFRKNTWISILKRSFRTPCTAFSYFGDYGFIRVSGGSQATMS